MASDILIKPRTLELIGGDVRIEKNLSVEGKTEVEGQLTVENMLVNKRFRVGSLIEAMSNPRGSHVRIKAKEIRLDSSYLSVGTGARISRGHLNAKSVHSPTIETGSVIIGHADPEGVSSRSVSGKLTIRDGAGSNSIVMDAAQKKINVKGVGDLVKLVQQLQLANRKIAKQMRSLEARLARLERK